MTRRADAMPVPYHSMQVGTLLPWATTSSCTAAGTLNDIADRPEAHPAYGSNVHNTLLP